MPQIEIRPAIATDIQAIMELDHDYTSEFVWQMDLEQAESGDIYIHFRQTRLPRPVKVEYPRSIRTLPDDWTQRSGLLVAVFEGRLIGYISLMLGIVPMTTWITDLVVTKSLRQKGIGSALILAAQEWAKQHLSARLLLEMQPKNYPGIQLAYKLGFVFCGYSDLFYPNQDIALFFGKTLH